MDDQSHLLVFRLDSGRYALPLAAVERVVRAAELTPLPNAPAIVLGVLDMGDRVVPVLDLRRRFGLPGREVGLDDQFLLARTSRRTVGLVVDEAQQVAEYPADAVMEATGMVPGLEHISGIARLHDGLVLIHDLEGCLSLDEEQSLARALSAETAVGR